MHPLIKNLEEFAIEYGLSPQNVSDCSISIWTSLYTGINMQINIQNDSFLIFNFYNRTTSHQYDGERTDLHDVISIILSAFLKKFNICSAEFLDIINPVTESEVEIYSRYIIPKQVNSNTLYINSLNEENIKGVIVTLSMFERYFWNCFGGCPCAECRNNLNAKYEYRWQGIHPKRMNKMTSVFGLSDDISYCERILPTWFYYRDFHKKITCIQSKNLVGLVKALDVRTKIIDGINGELHFVENFQHFISYNLKTKIEEYFKKLNDKKPKLILFENKILAVGSEYLLTFDEPCGFYAFKLEKEKVRERHKKEFELLFKPSFFTWASKIDGALFEEMIKDLLERDSNVLRVRKTSNTKERDGGADLIAEFYVQKKEHEIKSEHDTLYKKIKVVVQCKAYKNGVGKSDVLDIRDTIDYRNYGGYFLAISSYTKKSLSDYLDKLRTDGKFWIEWWTRSEIEDRLKQNEDLINKYNSIVKIKEVPDLIF